MDGGIWIVFRVLGGVVTVPVAEELAFRGFLLRRLVSSDFESVCCRTWTWLSVAGSSVLFGLMHGDQWLAESLPVCCTPACFCIGRIDAVFALAITNGLIAVCVLLGGRW